MDNQDLIQSLDNLENNLISVINDLKASTEIILKELTGYLNVSAHDLSEIRTTVAKVETIQDYIRDYISKLDNIEKGLNAIQLSINSSENKIINEFSKSFQENNENLKKIVSYIKYLNENIKSQNVENHKRLEKMETEVHNVALSFKDTKNELIKNQQGLYDIIDSLVKGKTTVEKAEISLQDSKIKSDTEKQKQKLWFWAKIIGIIFGSGGILFFIIKLIVGSM